MDTLLSYLLRFAVGGGVYVNASMSANYTVSTVIGSMSPHFYVLAPAGADREFILPPPARTLIGTPFLVSNSAAGGGYSVLVRGKTLTYTGTLSSASTIGTIPPGVTAYAICYDDGTYFRWKYQALSSADALTLTGTLSAVAAAFTGAVTTTDGVTSGTARKVGGLAYAATTATTLTNSTSETALGSYTIPANTLKAGTSLRFRAVVRVTGNAAADTITFKGKLGSTALFTSAAVAMVANDIAIVEGHITSRAAPGASAAVASNTRATVTVGGTAASVGSVPAPSNFATNGALVLALTGQWSAASASDIAICDQFDVWAEG